MERYSNNNNNNGLLSTKVSQINENLFHSNPVFSTNHYEQMCFVTPSQKQDQSETHLANTATTTSQLPAQLKTITTDCSQNKTYNTVGLFEKQDLPSTNSDDEPSSETYNSHTNIPPYTTKNCLVTNPTQRHSEEVGQSSEQLSPTLMKSTPPLLSDQKQALPNQNSHPNTMSILTPTSKAPMVSHQEGKAYYHCDICLKPFAQRHYLAIHKRSHTGEKPFQCDFCIQKFARRDTLQIHRRIHTGEKPFHCEVCSKQFAQRDKLQIHRRTHSRKKQFHCDICFKQFAQRDYIEIHKRSHTGERPFKCDFCMQRFVRKSTLDIHRRMHTGERPYHCEICGEMFAQTDKLKRHRKSAHGIIGNTASTVSEDVTCPEQKPTSSSEEPVSTSNMVALTTSSSKITEDLPTINQLWLL